MMQALVLIFCFALSDCFVVTVGAFIFMVG